MLLLLESRGHRARNDQAGARCRRDENVSGFFGNDVAVAAHPASNNAFFSFLVQEMGYRGTRAPASSNTAIRVKTRASACA